MGRWDSAQRQARRAQAIGRLHRCAVDAPIALFDPTIPRRQSAHNARLRNFLPIYATRARPGRHTPIAGKAPQIAGFFVTNETRNAARLVQLFKHIHSVAYAHDQWLAQRPEFLSQLVQAFGNEIPMAWTCIRLQPLFWLHHKQRHHWITKFHSVTKC